jgi:hypothetical protein
MKRERLRKGGAGRIFRAREINGVPFRPVRCGVIPLLVGVLLAMVVGCSGSSETYALEPTVACLGGKGVSVVEFEKPAPGEPVGPLRATHGYLHARGAVPVNVLFGKDAAEADAIAERLDDYHYPLVDGREYELELRRRGNAVLGAQVPVEGEYYDPPADEVDEALDAAERCLTAEASDDT